jgi:ABC-2 type transport system ATP-binding protein
VIQVENLTKHYVDFTALHGISFRVEKGEILGFLGPNGAGKTTTMRILTGFMPASGGRAVIDGLDAQEKSREVRQRIGYMPENVPLYPEMRVSEYLAFRAALKGVPRRDRARAIDEAIGRCGLGEVRRRIIGQLSKGFRQRVGLADALVHRPPILILDEPTAGLDPTQIREVRDLIKELGEERTVILSTHILPEVEMVCRRVVILARGRLVAEGTPAELRSQLEGRRVGGAYRDAPGARRIVCEVRGPLKDVEAALAAVAGVSRVEVHALATDPGGAGASGEAAVAEPLASYELTVDAAHDVREEVARAVFSRGFGLRELRGDRPSLEDVFVQLTTSEPAEDAVGSKEGASA